MKSLLNLVVILLFTSSNIQPSTCTDWQAHFEPNRTSIEIDGTEVIHLILTNLVGEQLDTINHNFVIRTQNEKVAVVVENAEEIEFFNGDGGSWQAHFHVKGVFLGEFLFLTNFF